MPVTHSETLDRAEPLYSHRFKAIDQRVIADLTVFVIPPTQQMVVGAAQTTMTVAIADHRAAAEGDLGGLMPTFFTAIAQSTVGSLSPTMDGSQGRSGATRKLFGAQFNDLAQPLRRNGWVADLMARQPIA